MSAPVLVEYRDAIAIVTLNRVDKRNALTDEVRTGLLLALHEIRAHNSARAIVLTGGKHFSAGGDIGGFDASGFQIRQTMLAGHEIVRALVTGPLPVVAAVEGNAFGAGLSLAMACDLVVAAEAATFCASFGRVGLMPDLGLIWSLPQRVGIGLARRLMLLCDPIGANEAVVCGLVDQVVPPGEALTVAEGLARRLACMAPGAVAATRAALARLPIALDQAMAWEADTQALLIGSQDFKEGMAAFFAKRTPVFRGG